MATEVCTGPQPEARSRETPTSHNDQQTGHAGYEVLDEPKGTTGRAERGHSRVRRPMIGHKTMRRAREGIGGLKAITGSRNMS